MNERLKELMLEAGYAAPELAGRAHKLAELLIRECVWEIYNHPTLYRDPNYKFETLLSDIKQHFGVK